MSDDVFTDPNDRIEIEPPEVGPAFTKVLAIALAKRLAVESKRPWTAVKESEMQEEIAALVAEARKCRLDLIKMILVKHDGERVVHELVVEKIGRELGLQ